MVGHQGKKPKRRRKDRRDLTTRLLTMDTCGAGIGLDWIDIERDDEGTQTKMDVVYGCRGGLKPLPTETVGHEEQKHELSGHLTVTLHTEHPGTDESLDMDKATNMAWRILARHLRNFAEVATDVGVRTYDR